VSTTTATAPATALEVEFEQVWEAAGELADEDYGRMRE
jgi:hypothetical protein